MENMVQKITELLNSQTKLMIEDEKGNLRELKAGEEVKGKVVEVSPKDEIYQLIWGKKRIGIKELKELRKTIFEVEKLVLKNVSPANRKDIRHFVETQSGL